MARAVAPPDRARGQRRAAVVCRRTPGVDRSREKGAVFRFKPRLGDSVSQARCAGRRPRVCRACSRSGPAAAGDARSAKWMTISCAPTRPRRRTFRDGRPHGRPRPPRPRLGASPGRPMPCPPHGFPLTPAPLAPGRGAARGGGGGEGRAVGRDATLRLRGGSTLALARRPPPCGRPASNAERSSSARASHRFGSNPATPRLASFIHTRPSVRSMSSDDSSRECRSQTSAQRQRSHVDVLLTCSCAYTFRLLMA